MIAEVQLTNTLDQWRQTTNAVIEQVNTLGNTGSVLSVIGPVSGQTLLYNGTVFQNVTLSGGFTVASNGVVTISSGALGGLTKGRVRFAGAISGLY